VVGAWAEEADLIAVATVSVLPGPLQQLIIEPNSVEIEVNVPLQFVAVASDRFGNPLPEVEVIWSVEPDSGNIDASGLFNTELIPKGFTYTISATATQGLTTQSATANSVAESGFLRYGVRYSSTLPRLHQAFHL